MGSIYEAEVISCHAEINAVWRGNKHTGALKQKLVDTKSVTAVNPNLEEHGHAVIVDILDYGASKAFEELWSVPLVEDPLKET